MNDDIEASIAVGHNGMVHIVSNPDRTIDIEKLYESLYFEYKEIYANSEIAKIYALDDLDDLYDLKIFDYESRWCFMAEKLYMQTDDRVKIGDKPMKHTDSKGQELHDGHIKNRKELLKQYKK